MKHLPTTIVIAVLVLLAGNAFGQGVNDPIVIDTTPIIIIPRIVIDTALDYDWLIVDSVFTPIVEPVDSSDIGRAVNVVCPKCGNCSPRFNEGWVTLMGCSEHNCCNTVTEELECRTTGDSFKMSHRDCDWFVWGYWLKRRIQIGDYYKLDRDYFKETLDSLKWEVDQEMYPNGVPIPMKPYKK